MLAGSGTSSGGGAVRIHESLPKLDSQCFTGALVEDPAERNESWDINWIGYVGTAVRRWLGQKVSFTLERKCTGRKLAKWSYFGSWWHGKGHQNIASELLGFNALKR